MHRAPLIVALALLFTLAPRTGRAQEVAQEALPELAAEPEPEPEAAPPPASVHIDLEANLPEVSYYLIHRSQKAPAFCPAEYWRPDCYRTIERYQPLCIAPCAIDLAPADVEVGVSMRGDRPIPMDPQLTLEADGVLTTEYTSRRRIRIAGGVVMAALVSFGLFNVIAGAWGDNDFYGNDDGGRARLIIGFSSIAVGFGAGVPMIIRKDEARIEFGAP